MAAHGGHPADFRDRQAQEAECGCAARSLRCTHETTHLEPRLNTATHQRQLAKVAAACRQIEQAPAPPTLTELAANAGYAPHHFQRLFKRITGLSPKQYAQAHRGRRLRRTLPGAVTVTQAMHDSGFDSSARFYTKAADLLGMPPQAYRQGGRNELIRFAVGQTSLGALLVAGTTRGICAIALGDDPQGLLEQLQRDFPHADLVGGDNVFEDHVAVVAAAVENGADCADLPLDIRGSIFQQQVWNLLRGIPAGTTVSYSEIAQRLGRPSAVRAVATACASNRIALAIPCHRVVRIDGNLAGYRWGIARKQMLLQRESDCASNESTDADRD
ncbi:MAG: methylated-DNA--[protein]-cysteine S-methyltransferase [Gammaproteobacteria bacterium]|nr:methylated-DNA--[protein]-cysteine S-methyltransferase [Gammaproteobacteria bacterium]